MLNVLPSFGLSRDAYAVGREGNPRLEANALYPLVSQTVKNKGEEFVATALRDISNQANLLCYSNPQLHSVGSLVFVFFHF